MRSFGTPANVTQRSNIFLHESNLVVQYHDLVPLEDKHKGREFRACALLGIGVIVRVLNKFQHKVRVPGVKLGRQTV